MAVVPLVVAFGFRAYVAVAARDVLQWDETYYFSQAVTGAGGRGLYPFVFGYPPMAILGGTGHLAWFYALAAHAAGPSVVALRLVSLVASVVAVLFMFLLARSLYGTAAAWMAAAITSALQLFVLSNSIRMDAMTFACVAAGLYAVVTALERDRAWRHVFAGLVFGIALQAHIDATVTALACGLVYLGKWIGESRTNGRWRFPAAAAQYAAGWTVGLAVFIAFNVLPDPDAFYRTTAQVRVDATSWYSGGSGSITGSFLNPSVILAKEASRYTMLYKSIPLFEIAAFVAAIVVMAVKRTAADRLTLTIVAGVLAFGAVILNNDSPLYFIHLTPVLVVPVAALFGRTQTSLGLAAFAVFVSAQVAVNSARPAAALARAAAEPEPAADTLLVERVRAVADSRCAIAGDGALYVRHFPDYPLFISTRKTEVSYAMMFYGITPGEEADYWRLKAPGVVFSREPVSDGLANHIASAGLTQIDTGIWMDTDHCRR